MTSEENKIALANLVIRKAGLIRTVRDVLHDENAAYFGELTEILDAVERAYAEEQAKTETLK